MSTLNTINLKHASSGSNNIVLNSDGSVSYGGGGATSGGTASGPTMSEIEIFQNMVAQLCLLCHSTLVGYLSENSLGDIALKNHGYPFPWCSDSSSPFYGMHANYYKVVQNITPLAGVGATSQYGGAYLMTDPPEECNSSNQLSTWGEFQTYDCCPTVHANGSAVVDNIWLQYGQTQDEWCLQMYPDIEGVCWNSDYYACMGMATPTPLAPEDPNVGCKDPTAVNFDPNATCACHCCDTMGQG